VKVLHVLRGTLLAAALLLGLGACYFTTTGQGSEGDLEITLQGNEITIPSVTHARVWLLSDNKRIPIGQGKDYIEVDLSKLDGNTIAIRGIPAGYSHVAMFSIGAKHDGWFEVKAWGETDPVTVVAGVDTEVTFHLKDATGPAFTYGAAAVMGRGIKGVATTGGNVYAVDSTHLFFGGTAGALADTGAALPGSRTINSVSIGVNFGQGNVWVNTTSGIIPYNGSLNEDLAGVTLPGVSVLESGGYVSGGNYVWFQQNGGLGGRNLSDAWVTADVSDLVSGQPVKDFAIIGGVGYFATGLGAFSLDDTMLDNNFEDFMNYSSFFANIGDGSAQYFVTSLASDSGTFYMGTGNGAYTDATPLENAVTPAALVAGTNHQKFLAIEATGAGNVAMLTENYLFLRSGGQTYRLPFCAGLPGKVTGLAWDGGTLIVSGTEGVVSIDAATEFAIPAYLAP